MSPTGETPPKRRQASALRRRIRSSALYWRVKLFLKRLSGREIWINTEVDLDISGSGDYRYDASRLNKDSVVYSFGVGDSVSFERDLIDQFGGEVHTFDPTPYTLDWIKTIQLPVRLKFYPWAVSGKDGELRMYPRLKQGKRSEVMWTTDKAQSDESSAVSVPAYSISSVAKKLGHDSVDMVKMDVEGSEYDVLSSMLRSGIFPNQILVEFHHRFPGIGQQATIDILRELRTHGYKVFWVSPTGREVCFVRIVE